MHYVASAYVPELAGCAVRWAPRVPIGVELDRARVDGRAWPTAWRELLGVDGCELAGRGVCGRSGSRSVRPGVGGVILPPVGGPGALSTLHFSDPGSFRVLRFLST